MSLQVWLPLNGNLNNQGLGTITSVNGTPSFKTSGKISNNALDLKTRITFICPQLANLQTFSIAFWAMVQTSDTLTSSWQDIMGFADVSSSGSGGTFRWETTYSSSNLGIHWHDNATNALVNGSHNHNTVKEQWVHCCVVFDQVAGKLYSYDNGIKTQTHNHLNGKFNSTGTFYLGETNNIEGMIQDVRIYDHALSDKEVEELAKGLVLHYKLNNEEYTNENLFSLENIYVNNSTVTKVVTGNTIELTSRAVNYGSFSANTYMDFEAGVTYTLSGHIKVIQKGTDNCVPRLCIRNNSHNIQVSQSVIDNESDVVMTLTPTSTFRGYVSGINTWSSGSSNTTNAITEFSKIKLEISSIKTPYIPNSNDVLYVALGYNKNIIYDSSGYENNGTKNGTFNALTNNPKYDIALSGTGTITTTIPTLASLLATGRQYTLACWARPTGTNENGWVIKMGNNSCGLWWAKSAARWVWNENDNGKRVIGTPIADDYTNWHHLVTTVDKTTATAFIAKHYVDGLPATGYAQQTWDNGSNASPTGTNIVMTLTNADLSDVRLYSTCLTDEQILELYNTSASIDNLGNIYSREYDEDDNLSITKTGEFKCSVIYDSDELTKASILKTNKQIQGKTLYEY